MAHEIGVFQCEILRDAMRIAAQFNPTVMMRIDHAGIYLSTVNAINAAAVWIDIPSRLFERRWADESPLLSEEIGVHCDKLCRMLYAYEAQNNILFSIEKSIGGSYFSATSGWEGNLKTPLIASDYVRPAPDPTHLKKSRELYITCVVKANDLRDWLESIDQVTESVVFEYHNCINKATVRSEIYPDEAKLVLEGSIPLISAPDNFATVISLELLQEAVAPECIDDYITIIFGKDEHLFMSMTVNGCEVDMVLAPKIDADYHSQL